jgi:hypothetical protein
MGPVRLFTLLAAGLLSLATAAPAVAAPVAAPVPAEARAQIHYPGSIRLMNDLNFATLAVTGAGTATVDPNTDVMTTTGGVVRYAGTPYSALFEAVSPIKTVVHIRAPRRPITLTRVGGTETMRVDNFTVSGTGTRNVVAKEEFTFSVGGTLYVNANQAEGLYTGTFEVELQYN